MIYTQSIKNLLQTAVFAAFPELSTNPDATSSATQINLEVPRIAANGDLSSNIAMALSRQLKTSPMQIAQQIVAQLAPSPLLANVDCAAPGFINFRMSDHFWLDLVAQINATDYTTWGQSTIGGGEKINLEFVSANPTGPMHIGHARGAIYGDILANILTHCGYDVTREFYINDAGGQIDTLIDSLWIRYQQQCGVDVSLPEHCYPGEYLIEAAQKLHSSFHHNPATASPSSTPLEQMPADQRKTILRRFIIAEMLNQIKTDLHALGVKHDVFISEAQDIAAAGELETALQTLQQKDLLYQGFLEKPKGEADADWEPRQQLLFKSSQFGDSNDRALAKSDGSHTYFLSDIAYHHHKCRRGFSKLLLILGADHIGYVSRLKAAVAAISDGKVQLEVIISEMVNLFDNGQKVKMSKRAGTFVTLREVLDALGNDILRFSMMWRKSDTPLDLDFAKAKEMSKENPIFYLQYAHTRIVSVIQRAVEAGCCTADEFIIRTTAETKIGEIIGASLPSTGSAAEEIPVPLPSKVFAANNYTMALLEAIDYTKAAGFAKSLIHKTAQFPLILEAATQTYEPHRLAYYLHDLAEEFHNLWNAGIDNPEVRFIVTDRAVCRARLAVLFAAAKTMAVGMRLMGIKPLLSM